MQAFLVIALFAAAATALTTGPRGELRGRVLLNEKDNINVDGTSTTNMPIMNKRPIGTTNTGTMKTYKHMTPIIVDRDEPEMTIDVLGGQPNQQGHLHYSFRRHFKNLVNPRNESGDWQWLKVKNSSNQDVVADSATFLRESLTGLDMVSVPYKNWVPVDQTRNGLLNNIEAAIVNKHHFVVEEGKKLKIRATFAVKVYNVEDQPYNASVVSNYTDDPTIASAGLQLATVGEHSLVFSIVATNNGIWSVYERNRKELVEHPERNDKVFMVFHRLADRTSSDEIIDAGITYDSVSKKVLFKLDNCVVHVINNIGELDKNDSASYALDRKNRQDLVPVVPTEFYVQVGLLSFLDGLDPNSPIDSVRDQRLSQDDNVYDSRAKFSDEQGLKENNLFGQGAALTLYDLDIELKESTASDREARVNNETEDPESVAPINDDDEETVPTFDVTKSKKSKKPMRVARLLDGDDEESQIKKTKTGKTKKSIRRGARVYPSQPAVDGEGEGEGEDTRRNY